jgi:hypothetical protein
MASPGPMPFLGASKTNARKAVLAMRLDEEADNREVPQAERAVRLHAFFQSDTWFKDFLPILRETYDQYLDRVKAHEIDPDALKVLDDLIQKLGGSVQLGIGAMERIAQRRLAAAEKVEQLHQMKSDSAY